MKIILIDSSYLTYKSFFAYKNKHLTVKKDGEEIITSSIFGFLREIIALKSEEEYDFIICAWDSRPYMKEQRYPTYKATREKQNIPSMTTEIELIKAIIYGLNIPSIISKGYEAEDVINFLIKKLSGENTVDIYGNDNDYYAILSSKTDMIVGRKKTKIMQRYTKKDLLKEFGITPKQYRTFKVFTGCKTDNVTGIPGIGPVNAIWLINNFQTTENVLKNLKKIFREKPKIAEKIAYARENKLINESRYLTKILTPKNIKILPQTSDLHYTDILGYIEAKTMLTGQNKMILEIIEKDQKEVFNRIMKKLKTMNHKSDGKPKLIMPFGEHVGEYIDDLISEKPKYINFLMNQQWFEDKFKDIYNHIEQEIDTI